MRCALVTGVQTCALPILLNSDVGLLESLLGDDSIFTNQDGMRLTKADDIAAHQSGLLAIETLSQQEERLIRGLGDTARVCLPIAFAVHYPVQPCRVTFRHSPGCPRH